MIDKLTFESTLALPQIINPYFARVIATLSRQASVRKPILFPLFERTQDIII